MDGISDASAHDKMIKPNGFLGPTHPHVRNAGLAGFAAQDQNTKLADLNANPPIASVPCGIGMKNTQVDLIQFVNSVLADIRGDGLPDRSHTLWEQYYTDTIEVALKAGLGPNAPPVPSPPIPMYRD